MPEQQAEWQKELVQKRHDRPAALFPMGNITATHTAYSTLDIVTVGKALQRHAIGDWGDVDEHDFNVNENALKFSDRLLSVYYDGDTRFWIITEADRSITTVLLPEDY